MSAYRSLHGRCRFILSNMSMEQQFAAIAQPTKRKREEIQVRASQFTVQVSHRAFPGPDAQCIAGPPRFGLRMMKGRGIMQRAAKAKKRMMSM